MGYIVYAEPAEIEVTDFNQALQALKNIVARNIGQLPYFDSLPDLMETTNFNDAMNVFGWDCEGEDPCRVISYDAYHNYPEAALLAIAPFVKGRVEIYAEEDSTGDKWMWVIDGGALYLRTGYTVYRDPCPVRFDVYR